MEIVAHVHGRSKRAYRALVQGGEAGPARESALDGDGGPADGRAGRKQTGGELAVGCHDTDRTGNTMTEGGREQGRKGDGYSVDGVEIAVVIAGTEPLDGVHGAPAFMGGQLFGFAMQVDD